MDTEEKVTEPDESLKIEDTSPIGVSRKSKTSPKGRLASSKEGVYTKLMMRSEKKPKSDYFEESETKPRDEREARYKLCKFVIQKYIERPLLLDERKFDIRVWVFIDSRGNAYFCKQGYLRMSSYKFELDPEDPDNRFVHLTNNAVQKYSKAFGS